MYYSKLPYFAAGFNALEAFLTLAGSLDSELKTSYSICRKTQGVLFRLQRTTAQTLLVWAFFLTWASFLL
jgi:hypothetical protein